MSKISRDNKKKALTKKAAATKKVAAEPETPKSMVCSHCKYYDKPCRKTGEFVAKKHEPCPNFK